MTKDIFLQLVTRLKSFDAAFQDLTYSKIQHYDLFKNQYNKPEGNNPYNKPAVFFELIFDFTDNGQLSQQGTGTIRVHIVQEDYADSADGSSNQDEALKRLEFVDLVHESLHGYDGDGFGKLMRRRFAPDTDPSDLVVNIIDYTCSLMDDSTHRLKYYVLTEQDDTDLSAAVQLVEPLPPVTPTPSKYSLPPA